MTTPSVEPGITVDTETIVSDSRSRYFIIKSYSHDNIGRSLQYGVWATSQKNERILRKAYETSPFVVLIFSVNHSSRFSGFAVMTSIPGRSSCEGRSVFCGPDGTHFPGRMFSIHWMARCELFFRDCEHLINTLNENKSVKVGRDGQEMDYLAGAQLCLLMDSNQLPQNRPAPLILDSSRSANSDVCLPSIPRAQQSMKPYQDAHQADEVLGSAPQLVERLAAVATFLKQGTNTSNTSPSTSFSKIKEPPTRLMTTRLASTARKPPHTLEPPCVSLDWVEKEILLNPILSIFPLNLTQISSYEHYIQLYSESQSAWEEFEQKYGSELVPSLPASLALSADELACFDATVLVDLVARSASQEDVDKLIAQFCPRPAYDTLSQRINVGAPAVLKKGEMPTTHLPERSFCDPGTLTSSTIPLPYNDLSQYYASNVFANDTCQVYDAVPRQSSSCKSAPSSHNRLTYRSKSNHKKYKSDPSMSPDTRTITGVRSKSSINEHKSLAVYSVSHPMSTSVEQHQRRETSSNSHSHMLHRSVGFTRKPTLTRRHDKHDVPHGKARHVTELRTSR